MLTSFVDVESQARVLALFVSSCFGGEGITAEMCMRHTQHLKRQKGSNVLLLGTPMRACALVACSPEHFRRRLSGRVQTSRPPLQVLV